MTFAALARSSVMAVPPLPLNDKEAIAWDEVAKILARLKDGGVDVALFGGNANLYHLSLANFEALADGLAAVTPAGMTTILSVGPDCGRLDQQASIVRRKAQSFVMLLPLIAPSNSGGVGAAVRRFHAGAGCPVILYIREEAYLSLDEIEALIADGVACGIKYAIPRDRTSDDAYLHALKQRVGLDFIISGFGEPPALIHAEHFGIQGFTSGTASVAPRLSARIHQALAREDWPAAAGLVQALLPLENLRDRLGPVRTLHEAMSSARVARCGPVPLPMAPLSPAEREELEAAVDQLVAAEARLTS